MAVVKRRAFPASFKREAVDRVNASELSVGEVATELGVHVSLLRRWMAHYATEARGSAWRPITQGPVPSPGPTPADLAADNDRLRRENDRLRMERDILKKAALIFGAASR
jgi:transposase